MQPYEHFIATYLGPMSSFMGLLMVGVIAVLGWRQDAKFAAFKEEIMEAINGKYMHSKVAESKFESLHDQLDTLSDMFSRFVFSDYERSSTKR